MKNIILTSVFVCVFNICLSQQKIVYILPDTVELEIDKHLKSIDKKSNEVFDYYFILKKDTAFFQLEIIPYNIEESGYLLSWINVSNRVVIINDCLYPLLFDYDFSFATISNIDNIGKIGHRIGEYRSVSLISHNVSIFFNQYGIIKSDL
jgi:hypothetical protein